MSAHNIPFLLYKKEKQPIPSQISSYGIFSKGLKKEFETTVVNEPLVFEPLKFYCTWKRIENETQPACSNTICKTIHFPQVGGYKAGLTITNKLN